MHTDSGFPTRPLSESASGRRSRLATDCHAVLDLEGRFAVVSDELAACLDVEADALVGMDLEHIVDIETPREVLQDLWRTLAGGGTWSAALELRSGAGKLWIKLTVAPDTNRGQVKAYLAQFRPAFEREIAQARASFGKLAEGAEFDRGRCLASVPTAWFRRLFRDSPEDGLGGLGIAASGIALVLLLFHAAWLQSGDPVVSVGMLGLSVIAILGGIGFTMRERRQRRREYRAVRDIIDRIAQGETDAGSSAASGIEHRGLRDALRRLQLKLSMLTAGFSTPARDATLADEHAVASHRFTQRLRRLERRCAELAALARQASDATSGTAPRGLADMVRLAALLARVEALHSTGQVLERTSLQSRVLGLNLALLQNRVDLKGLDRASVAAKSIARDAAVAVARMSQELDSLKAELQSLIDALSLEKPQVPDASDTLCDGLTELSEELRLLQPATGPGRHGAYDRSGAAVAAPDAGHARGTAGPPGESGRSVGKVARLKAVGSAPVPRVGRGRHGGPLEDDWRA
jgi:hypothetical protein